MPRAAGHVDHDHGHLVDIGLHSGRERRTEDAGPRVGEDEGRCRVRQQVPGVHGVEHDRDLGVVERLPEALGRGQRAGDDADHVLLDHLVGAVGGPARVGLGRAGHQLDRPPAEARAVLVQPRHGGVGGVELDLHVGHLARPVGDEADLHRLAAGRRLRSEHVGGAGRALRRAIAATASARGAVVVVTAARGRDEQDHGQCGHAPRKARVVHRGLPPRDLVAACSGPRPGYTASRSRLRCAATASPRRRVWRSMIGRSTMRVIPHMKKP